MPATAGTVPRCSPPGGGWLCAKRKAPRGRLRQAGPARRVSVRSSVGLLVVAGRCRRAPVVGGPFPVRLGALGPQAGCDRPSPGSVLSPATSAAAHSPCWCPGGSECTESWHSPPRPASGLTRRRPDRAAVKGFLGDDKTTKPRRRLYRRRMLVFIMSSLCLAAAPFAAPFVRGSRRVEAPPGLIQRLDRGLPRGKQTVRWQPGLFGA